MYNSSEPQTKAVKVWDIYTRLFHWALAIAITVSFISQNMDEMEIHVGSGVFILGLVAFRLLWGVFGARTAQFVQFVRGPRAILGYIKDSEAAEFRPMIGHSPLGALSVVALLALVAIQAGTGLFASDDIYTEGPLKKFVSSEFNSWATSIHGLNSDFLLVMIGLHIAAIAFYRVFKRNDLVTPMVSGNKQLPVDQTECAPVVRERNPIIAAAAIAAAAAFAYYIYTI